MSSKQLFKWTSRIALILIVFVVCNCFRRYEWHIYETKTLQLNSLSGESKYLSAIQETLNMFKKNWSESWVKDYECYYIDHSTTSFKIQSPEMIYDKVVSGEMPGLVMSLHFQFDDQLPASWLDLKKLRPNCPVKYDPSVFVENSYDEKCRFQRGMKIQVSEKYVVQQGWEYFVLLMGLREYCLNESGKIVTENIMHVPGSLFPYQFLICIQSDSKVTVWNLSSR